VYYPVQRAKMRIKRNVYILSGIIVLLLFSLLACLTKPPPQGTGLENKTWLLQSYWETGNLRAVIHGTEITVTFDSGKGQVYGSAGANTYSGSYKVSGDKLSIRQLAWTEMYRLDPPGVMEQEAEYLRIFKTGESFQVNNTTLQINSGKQVLIYIEKTTGTLRGNVTIGPITPVERPGENPTVPPEVYEARKIMVYDKNRDKLIAQVDIDSNGYYEVGLKAGIYTVDINQIGMDRSSDVPKQIKIGAGKTIELNIDIDTGIR
jgi:heat shock protein HslJ